MLKPQVIVKSLNPSLTLGGYSENVPTKTSRFLLLIFLPLTLQPHQHLMRVESIGVVRLLRYWLLVHHSVLLHNPPSLSGYTSVSSFELPCRICKWTPLKLSFFNQSLDFMTECFQLWINVSFLLTHPWVCRGSLFCYKMLYNVSCAKKAARITQPNC